MVEHGSKVSHAGNGTISSAVLGEHAPSDEDEDFHVPSAETLDTIVSEHRQNDGLWHKADTPMEASLQHELRRLHDAVDEHLVGRKQKNEDTGY